VKRLEEIAEAFLQFYPPKDDDHLSDVDITALSLDDAYDIQKRIAALRESEGARIVGYKVGCTSRSIRQQFGLSDPIRGRILAPYVHHGDTVLPWNDFIQCAVEPEFVFGIGRDVPSEIGHVDDALQTIAWVAPGIELHHYKFWFGEPTSQELIVSNGIHAGLVIGKQRVLPSELDLDLEGVGLFRNGELAASGIGAEVMGGPLNSLRWLANHLIRHDEHLREGDVVIPGSAVPLVRVDPNDQITAAFTRLGRVTAEFRG